MILTFLMFRLLTPDIHFWSHFMISDIYSQKTMVPFYYVLNILSFSRSRWIMYTNNHTYVFAWWRRFVIFQMSFILKCTYLKDICYWKHIFILYN